MHPGLSIPVSAFASHPQRRAELIESRKEDGLARIQASSRKMTRRLMRTTCTGTAMNVIRAAARPASLALTAAAGGAGRV